MIKTRWSRPRDAPALAEIHRDAWRFAYAGLLPGLALERMIAAHGPRWWDALQRQGSRTLVLELDGNVVGYARIGACRSREFAGAGEIYELYLDPICHGAGLGKRLFREARRRLAARLPGGLIVWSLAINKIGCRFYRALGGKVLSRDRTRFGGVEFERIAFAWP